MRSFTILPPIKSLVVFVVVAAILQTDVAQAISLRVDDNRSVFLNCLTNLCPTAPCVPALYASECTEYDCDEDGDIDLVDFACFQVAYTSSARTILIDFGSVTYQTTEGPPYWNNVTSSDMLDTVNLTNVDGLPTGIELLFAPDKLFNAANTSGTESVAPGSALDQRSYPIFAIRDSLHGDNDFDTVELTILGVHPAYTYDLTFFASRVGIGDIRSATYSVSGSSNNYISLNASNNDSEIAELSGISPDAQGKFVITVTKATDNNNPSGLFYMGTMEIHRSVP